MSHAETFGNRRGELLYSEWHRPRSIRRFISHEDADALHVINLDTVLRCDRWIEYAKCCKEPLALIETAIENGQEHKTATVTRNLARRCDPPVEAYVVLIRPEGGWTGAWSDIEGFRVRMIYPRFTQWVEMTPSAWARKLLEIRGRAHHAPGCRHQRRDAA